MSARRDFGSIRRLPSGRWQVRYRDGENRLVAASQTLATKAEASNHLAAMQTDQARGAWVDPAAGQVPFEEYARTWLAERELRPRTRELYSGLLTNHVLPAFVPVPLAKVSSALVRTWHATRLGSGAFFGPPKSDAGRRSVHIPPHLLPEIERHLERYVDPDPDALLFRGPRGGLVRRNNFNTTWDAARRAAGRSDLHFHDLRHLAATLTATTGATTRELMARDGPLLTESGTYIPARHPRQGPRDRHRPQRSARQRAGSPPCITRRRGSSVVSSRRHRRRLRAQRSRQAGGEVTAVAAEPAALQSGGPARVETDHLVTLITQRRAAAEAVDREARRLAERGVSWAAIGRALGMSRQGARQKYLGGETSTR